MARPQALAQSGKIELSLADSPAGATLPESRWHCLYLVGGLVAIFLFSHEYWVAFIILIDELIFFRGVAKKHQPDMIFMTYTP